MATNRTSGRPGKGQRTRQALVDAAVRRFASEGFARTSLADVAADAGLTPSGVYRYFDDKEALFQAAVDADTEGLVGLARAGLQVEAAGSFLDLLGGLAEGVADAVREHPLVARVLAGGEILPPEAIAELPSVVGLRAEIAELIAAGQEAGLVRRQLDPGQAALGLESVVLDHVARLVGADDPASLEKNDRWVAVVALLEAALTP